MFGFGKRSSTTNSENGSDAFRRGMRIGETLRAGGSDATALFVAEVITAIKSGEKSRMTLANDAGLLFRMMPKADQEELLIFLIDNYYEHQFGNGARESTREQNVDALLLKMMQRGGGECTIAIKVIVTTIEETLKRGGDEAVECFFQFFRFILEGGGTPAVEEFMEHCFMIMPYEDLGEVKRRIRDREF